MYTVTTVMFYGHLTQGLMQDKRFDSHTFWVDIHTSRLKRVS